MRRMGFKCIPSRLTWYHQCDNLCAGHPWLQLQCSQQQLPPQVQTVIALLHLALVPKDLPYPTNQCINSMISFWLAPVLAKHLSPQHIEAYIKHGDHHHFPGSHSSRVSITSLEAMGRLLMMMAKTFSINRTKPWTCSKKKRNCTKEIKERGRRNRRSWEIFRRKDVCKQTLIQHKVQAWILMCRPCLHSANTGKQNPNNDYTHFCSCVLWRLELISNRSLFQ